MKAYLRTVVGLLLVIAPIAAPCAASADTTESNPQTVLHLLDYDHAEPEETAVMRRREQELLDQFRDLERDQ